MSSVHAFVAVKLFGTYRLRGRRFKRGLQILIKFSSDLVDRGISELAEGRDWTIVLECDAVLGIAQQYPDGSIEGGGHAVPRHLGGSQRITDVVLDRLALKTGHLHRGAMVPEAEDR